MARRVRLYHVAVAWAFAGRLYWPGLAGVGVYARVAEGS